MRMHPGRLYGQMQKKLRCIKVEFTYPKTTDLVTRGRKLDFVVRYCSTWRAKHSSTVVERTESGAKGEDYFNRVLLYYEAKTGVSFKFYLVWEVLKGSPKWIETEVPKFLAKSGGRLMVSEMATHNERGIKMQKEECKAFLEIKRREVICHERELANQEYRKRQEDIRFYLQLYDHLNGDVQTAMEALRAEIKAKYNLPY
ncbi:hypothetical protein Tco_0015291 [Tanacetum coccineum]